MEVILGFAVGYWVGTRQGRDGLQKVIDSAQAIWASPETKRLLKDGLTAFEAAAPAIERLQKHRGGMRAAIIRNVVDDIIDRRNEHRAKAA